MLQHVPGRHRQGAHLDGLGGRGRLEVLAPQADRARMAATPVAAAFRIM